ncbi:hypothetical protein BDR06DRAFT_1014430 [Suillus hirtellus]|nr:hypothetical protein BDR06DRAFT_1014430 [Suillus hirtellus]
MTSVTTTVSITIIFVPSTSTMLLHFPWDCIRMRVGPTTSPCRSPPVVEVPALDDNKDYTRSEGINYACNRIFIISIIRKIFGESSRLRLVYGRREGKPIIVMSFYCNFDVS